MRSERRSEDFVRVRFAPSPTGYIHIGNARTALLNWLFARKHSGTFLLRFDDTDLARSKDSYAQAIEEDLHWLTIPPDQILYQSQRFEHYHTARDYLKATQRLYRCYETQEELEYRRKRQIAQGKAPLYDRAAWRLTEAEKVALEAKGRLPHWRFKLKPDVVRWEDLIRGSCHIDCASLSDPVLIREDGTYLYTLPSVVDDIATGITHILRGEDHVTNTGVQIQLFEALLEAPHVPAQPVPLFGHHNLLTTLEGEGLSKRFAHLSLRNLREQGIEALAVAALAVLTGSSEAIRPITSLQDLLEPFNLDTISRNPAKFDPSELEHLSAKTLHLLPFEEVQARLESLGIHGAKAPLFWESIRKNVMHFSQAETWWSLLTHLPTPSVLEKAANEKEAGFLKQAATLLPPEPWDLNTWKKWREALAEHSGRKGRDLFHPLRLALTGREDGPELSHLLLLLEPQEVMARLLR